MYVDLAGEYDRVFGRLAERTWRTGVLAEVARVPVPPGGLVADLGCGTGIGGRLLGSIGCGARRIGIDRSEPMLRRAIGSYEWTVLGDAVRPPVRPASVALMVSGFDTLNYLDPAALGRCLRGASRCLLPGGWLIFDYSSPALVRRRFSRVEPVPGGVVTMEHRYQPDRDRSVSLVERRMDGGAVRWRETHIQFAVAAHQLRRLSAAAHLRVEHVRNLAGPGFSPRANTHIWVLRRD
jgi:SAM-dependent methyltransferase